jgi:hypothetical protein
MHNTILCGKEDKGTSIICGEEVRVNNRDTGYEYAYEMGKIGLLSAKTVAGITTAGAIFQVLAGNARVCWESGYTYCVLSRDPSVSTLARDFTVGFLLMYASIYFAGNSLKKLCSAAVSKPKEG